MTTTEPGAAGDDAGEEPDGRPGDEFGGGDRPTAVASRRRHDRLEVVGTVLLAVASVLTAWSTFQATKWSGIQAIRFNEAVASRTESARASTFDIQEIAIDITLWTVWVDARLSGRDEAAIFLESRFDGGLEIAHEAWVAAGGLDDAAEETPFEREEYNEFVLELITDSMEMAEAADERFEAARDANRIADTYVLTTVVLAMVLFFAGISPKFSALRAQRVCVISGAAALAAGVSVLLTLPVEFP